MAAVDADVVVVGAGIVGLAAARAVQRRHRGASVVVLDKEDGPARHQTGRNSGVVHAGLYYTPGSAKAQLVAIGRRRLERYCAERDLPYHRCGKVIVANDAEEVANLAQLARRAAENGVEARPVDARRLHELEPHVRAAAALFVPSTAITDYGAVARALAQDVVDDGGELRTGVPVRGVSLSDHERIVRLDVGTSDFRARWFLNCAGLQSDRLARSASARGVTGAVSIVPFRGEYHELTPSARGLVRNLIYPVPDARWPFLGMHMTRMVDGSVHVGPNAVLSLGRETYSGGAELADVRALVGNRGLWRLGARYWRTGAEELIRSRSHRLFVRDAQRLIPEIGPDDVVRSGSGIRAQALAADGTLLDDFAFARSPRGVHVLNAPSPAATASLAIGDVVADQLDLAMRAE